MIKKTLFLLLVLLSAKAFSQEHWEDEFWREEGKKRYAKTLSMAGMYTTFYDNGKIKWQGKCLENGNPDSVWVYYNEEGNKLWEGEYNGKYCSYKQFYDYGAENEYKQTPRWDTSIIGNYKNGLKNGEWQEYDYNGTFIIKKGNYLNGEPTGLWQEFTTQAIQPVEKKITKTAEYNYHTQTRTLFKKDSIDGTSHIDSLNYASQYGITGHGLINDYHTNDAVNVCFVGSVQFINLTSLNNHFHQSNYNRIETPLQTTGMEISARAMEKICWSLSGNWTPATSSQLNDSIRLRLSGSSFSFSMGIDLLHKNYVFDLAPTLGFGFQQLKLKALKINNADTTGYSFNEGDYRVYHNSAATFNAMLNFRINMGFFTIGLSGGYILDCSSSKWRYNGKLLKDSPRTSLSGLIANVSIGFHFPPGGEF